MGQAWPIIYCWRIGKCDFDFLNLSSKKWFKHESFYNFWKPKDL